MRDPSWVSAQLSKEYTRQALRIAEQLRDAADRIQREATAISVDRTTGVPDHNRSAAAVLNAINVFHGNLFHFQPAHSGRRRGPPRPNPEGP
jgi:hypothetical protein